MRGLKAEPCPCKLKEKGRRLVKRTNEALGIRSSVCYRERVVNADWIGIALRAGSRKLEFGGVKIVGRPPAAPKAHRIKSEGLVIAEAEQANMACNSELGIIFQGPLSSPVFR
jgi:hypothetical protein